MRTKPSLKRERKARALPPVAMLRVTHANDQGVLFAIPDNWRFEEAPLAIWVRQGRRFQPSEAPLEKGERFLARIVREGHPSSGCAASYSATPIRRMTPDDRGPLLGQFHETEGGEVWFSPAIRSRRRLRYAVQEKDHHRAQDGDFIEVEPLARKRAAGGRRTVAIRRNLGASSSPGALTALTIAEQGIVEAFPQEALKEAARAQPLQRGEKETRKDLCDLPFLAIDPENARDHDDAVCALPDASPDNEGGWVLWVAIADVAHYVPEGSALDAEARRRGCSIYFPDRAVPMLPPALSGDLCSLRAGEIRPVLGVRIRFEATGARRDIHVARGMVRLRGVLTYEAAQRIADLEYRTSATEQAIANLFALHRLRRKARASLPPLNLDLPERVACLASDGSLESIRLRARLDSHRMIEEMMILANEAVAEHLKEAGIAQIFRIHEQPDGKSIETLRDILRGLAVPFPRSARVRVADFNRALAHAAGTDWQEIVSQSVLRAQQQARYDCRNAGHFGLNLASYAHFTSPIRRYPDLVTHRILCAHLQGRQRALQRPDLARIARESSERERAAVDAERAAMDRYVAAHLADRAGATFAARVTSATRFGLFMRLDESEADGFVPMRFLGEARFTLDRTGTILRGGGRRFTVGQRLLVRLIEANPASGGLLFSIAGEQEAQPAPKSGRKSPP